MSAVSAVSAAGVLVLAIGGAACSADGSGKPTGTDVAAANGASATDPSPDAGLLSATLADGTAPDGAAPLPPPAPPPPPSEPALAKGVVVSDVAVLQGVKVRIVTGGAKIAAAARNAQVVANRPGLLRVYVTPGADFVAASLTAELRIAVSGSAPVLLNDTKIIAGPSSDADLASTFNFDLDPNAIPTNATFSIAITDPAAAPAVRSAAPDPARYPADGTLDAFDAKNSGTLRVKLVPLRYDADGSSRLPDTTAAQVALYQQTLFAMYPVSTVEVTVRAATSTSTLASASGAGWSTTLQMVTALRAADAPPADVYYTAIFAPSATFNAYCGASCMSGLGTVVTNPLDAAGRVALALGFTGAQFADIAAHEIGHNHGRTHAPCGATSSLDPAFPYPGASIGTWGYDIRTKTLLDATSSTDVMSYCKPDWISDYTYRGLFDRLVTVNGTAGVAAAITTGAAGAGAGAFQVVSVETDGSLHWGEHITVSDPPRNEPRAVRWTSATGATLATGTAYFYPYSELGGGHLLVPEGPPGFAKIEITGLRGGAKSALER